MSSAKDHPFVLSLDAILNLKAIFNKLSDKEFYAAPDSGHNHFRPEFHLPNQLLLYAYAINNQDAPIAKLRSCTGGISDMFVSKLIMCNHSERSATKDGDVCYGLNQPCIRLVHDSDHGIVHNPNLYGEQFVPTQLVIEHATRLARLAAKNQATSQQYPEQQDVIDRANVIVVTKYPATIYAALAEGFQVWDYDDKTTYAGSTTAYEQLLMLLGLAEVDRTSGTAVPKVYPDTATQTTNESDDPVPPPYGV